MEFFKRGIGRYTALVLGLGAAGVAIGWISHDLKLTGSSSAR